MKSQNVIPIGCADRSRLSNQVVRIVHISDTHLQHASLSPLRPISGNISIQRSSVHSASNQVVDEAGFDAFEKLSSPGRNVDSDATDSRHETSFHRGGTFLSSTSSSIATNPNEIPSGDVLVHSGDFDWTKISGGFFRSNNFEEIVQVMNDFFDRFPHKMKIFVAGNHELSFRGKSQQEIQERLSSAVYLMNSSHTYKGIHFYGSPYTPFRMFTNARAYIRTSSKIGAHWRDIPTSTDVLITHTPPFGILDFRIAPMSVKMPRLSKALRRFRQESSCLTCHLQHPGLQHTGCPILREEILNRIKPRLHLFGHCHESNGVTEVQGITFSNSAFYLKKQIHVFDYFCS